MGTRVLARARTAIREDSRSCGTWKMLQLTRIQLAWKNPAGDNLFRLDTTARAQPKQITTFSRAEAARLIL